MARGDAPTTTTKAGNMASLKVWPATAIAALFLATSCTEQVVESSRNANRPEATSVALSTSNAAGAAEQRFTAFLTGYGYWDNTPPGSAAIAKPVVHRRAGGTGTYADPITIAVGHRIEGGRQTLDYRPGTRFYIERLRKYAIVEDVCGDGTRPQDGPCHTGYRGHPWLDIYIGGARLTAAHTNSCARKITALQTLVINPRPDYPVAPGEISASGCQVF